MTNEGAIELLNKALRCVQTDPRNCGECKKCENYATKEDGIEAIRMAIAALEGKDIDVPSKSALDHIHNVVAENERKRGYEQAKAEYDHKLTVIKKTIKDYWYIKGYEQGKADANRPEIPDSWIPVSERLPEKEDCPMDCLVTRKSKTIGNYTDMAVAESDGTWTHEDWKAITFGDRVLGKKAGLISTRDDDIVAWMPLPEPWK